MSQKFCKTFTALEKKKIVPVENSLGMIHSIETFGALDGPGLRVVVFFEGCPLRCVYCHNRDMLDMKNYMTISSADLLKMVKKYTPYFGDRGGVTVSGGDPVFQPKFLREFLKLCKENGIHTTIDTSLFTSEKVIDDIVPFADLFMVSLKHFDSGIHKCLTGVPNELIIKNIRYLNKKLLEKSNGSRLWFRYLILPGYTDTRSNLCALIQFLHEMHFEKIELLPYHTFGVYKWKELEIPYVLEGVKSPSERSVRKIRSMLKKEGFSCHCEERV
ncbi:pyruvate formate lyase-activating protein [Candidatus Peregrinibacteria bacterium]|nr:pyruvate formate lyase-activating protein [Candidatus Peregrinibacteria bacterium]